MLSNLIWLEVTVNKFSKSIPAMSLLQTMPFTMV
jgi:hypothetical protein